MNVQEQAHYKYNYQTELVDELCLINPPELEVSISQIWKT